MRPILSAAMAAPLLLLGIGTASSHSGGLDVNGCHYEPGLRHYHCHQKGKLDADPKAVAKKSRENICHDATSPNYKTLKYYAPYPSMEACLKSGGMRFGSGGSK